MRLRIKEAMERARHYYFIRITPREIKDRLRVSDWRWRGWMKADSTGITPEQIAVLCEILCCTPDYLFGWDSYEFERERSYKGATRTNYKTLSTSRTDMIGNRIPIDRIDDYIALDTARNLPMKRERDL